MNFSEIENWIQNKLIINRNLSLSRISKGVKLFEILYTEMELGNLERLDSFLSKTIRLIDKKSRHEIKWFKINIVDNAITQLIGIGNISNRNDLSLIIDLLTKDTADQGGDTIIGLFNDDKNWILKITNCQDEDKIHVKIYGNQWIVEKLKETFR